MLQAECLYPSQCWSPNTQMMVLGHGALGGCLGHKNGVLLDGISALIQETHQSSLIPPTMWKCKEKFGTKKRVLTPWCWHPHLRLLASRTIRNTFLSFIGWPVHGIWLSQPERASTVRLLYQMAFWLGECIQRVSMAPGFWTRQYWYN